MGEFTEWVNSPRNARNAKKVQFLEKNIQNPRNQERISFLRNFVPYLRNAFILITHTFSHLGEFTEWVNLPSG